MVQLQGVQWFTGQGFRFRVHGSGVHGLGSVSGSGVWRCTNVIARQLLFLCVVVHGSGFRILHQGSGFGVESSGGGSGSGRVALQEETLNPKEIFDPKPTIIPK